MKGNPADLAHVPTLGLSIMDAFAEVAPRVGVRLIGLPDDANEHSFFWQQIADSVLRGKFLLPDNADPPGGIER